MNIFCTGNQNKLSNRINTIIHRKKTLLDTYSLRILSKTPKLYIQSYTEKLVFNSKLLINSYNEKIKDYSYLIDQYKNKLSAYDVNNIKNRGFFIIKKNGSILTSRKQFKLLQSSSKRNQNKYKSWTNLSKRKNTSNTCIFHATILQ